MTWQCFFTRNCFNSRHYSHYLPCTECRKAVRYSWSVGRSTPHIVARLISRWSRYSSVLPYIFEHTWHRVEWKHRSTSPIRIVAAESPASRPPTVFQTAIQRRTTRHRWTRELSQDEMSSRVDSTTRQHSPSTRPDTSASCQVTTSVFARMHHDAMSCDSKSTARTHWSQRVS